MGYENYEVKITFLSSETGSVDYDLPYVFSVSDPQPQGKDTVIQGTRGDGSIRIPGGKKSQEIKIQGKLYDPDGYKDLTTLMNTMRSSITTDLATLTMQHKEGTSWITDWTYTVFRNTEINFPTSLRTGVQQYSVSFLVVAY